MRVTENAGFIAKVQRNLGFDFVTKQHKSLKKTASLRLSVSDVLTCLLSLWRADTLRQWQLMQV